jgi:hypothetical protein
MAKVQAETCEGNVTWMNKLEFVRPIKCGLFSRDVKLPIFLIRGHTMKVYGEWRRCSCTNSLE